MPTLKDALKLKANPFENYTAENEPDISSYAVKPAYIDTITQRAYSRRSFILFGDRGAGKSATRVTLFNDIWSLQKDEGKPFVVNFLDFSACLPKLAKGNVSEVDLIREVAYIIIEQLFIWLSSLSEEDRITFVEALTSEERVQVRTLLEAFYFSKAEADRHMSEGAALRLLGHAWRERTQLWTSRRWDAISKVIGSVAGMFARKVDKDLDISQPVEALLKSVNNAPNGGRVLLEKLVDLVKIFSFTGIVVLIDKVDETELTSASTEKSANLIGSLLAHVQLLEIEDFSWIFFLWDDIRPHFEKEGKIRLDKIANTKIEWSEAFLRKMLDERVKYFSDGKLSMAALFSPTMPLDDTLNDLIRLSMKSPRELVRLLDNILAEHDAKFAGDVEPKLLESESIEGGKDKYVKTRVNDVYSAETIRQVCRLPSLKFINKDVQAAFRIGVGSARNRVSAWQAAGIVKLTGTRASEGDQGGKPNNEYSVVDARIARLIDRSLIEIDDIDSEPFQDDHEGEPDV